MQTVQTVRLEIDGPVAEIVLNRPDKRNAVNTPLIAELQAAIDAVEENDDVRVAIFRGEGPVFCAGNDLKERSSMSVEQLRVRRTKGRATIESIAQMTKPCIAAVHGAAVAAGCEIAFATDFVVAGESASFRYPVGVRGSVGDALRLPHIVGKAMAKELLYTGRPVEATEALRIGMVNHVVPDDQLVEFARGIAMSIAEHPPFAMSAMKQAIERGEAIDPESAAKLEQQAIDAAVAFRGDRG